MAEQRIGVGLIGCGTVGSGVARLLAEQGSVYARRLGKSLDLRRVLVRDTAKARTCNGSCVIDRKILTDDPQAFFATADMPIVVEVAGGVDPVGDYVRQALTAGKHVVTANKALLATQGPDLFQLGRKHNAAIAFEASCGGGIPVITALQFGLVADRIDALYGILNGTSNYILTEMTQNDKTYDAALVEAGVHGFAEADPTDDVSGRDTAQKLAVLASLAFRVCVGEDQVRFEGIDELDLADVEFGAELGYDIKLLAIAERADELISLRVHPSFINARLPLAQVHGSFNALSVFGHSTGHTMYYGRGAGQLPTASAVVSDLLNVAGGWYPQAFSKSHLWCDGDLPPRLLDPQELVSRFYLRLSAMDVPGVMAKVSGILGDAGISLDALSQHEVASGQFVPVVIITHQARQGSLFEALEKVEKLDVIDGKPVCIRIVDIPQD